MELRICSISINFLKFSCTVNLKLVFSVFYASPGFQTDAVVRMPGCKFRFGPAPVTHMCHCHRLPHARVPGLTFLRPPPFEVHNLATSAFYATDPEASMPSLYTQAENRGIGCTSRSLLRTKHLNEATTHHLCPVVGQWVLTHGWLRCSPRPFCKALLTKSLQISRH